MLSPEVSNLLTDHNISLNSIQDFMEYESSNCDACCSRVHGLRPMCADPCIEVVKEYIELEDINA